MTLRILLLALVVSSAAAAARDNGQWAANPPHIRQDAFEADNFEVEDDHYVAIITNGRGVLPNGKKIPVPNHKMKWDSGNPTGHGIIFIGTEGDVYCYVAPGGV